MSDIQRDHEQRYHTMQSRWLAYCYAVGRHPTGPPPAGAEFPVVWIGSRMTRARAELGKGEYGVLTDDEQAQCTALLWRYAVEERA